MNYTTDRLPFCPVTKKDTRVFTKHYTNLFYYRDRNIINLFSFLIYESGADNKLSKVGLLKERYCASVKAASSVFITSDNISILKSSYNTISQLFEKLCNDGLILCSDKGLYINPMFSYRADYISKKNYIDWCELYQKEGDINVLVNRYTDIVKRKIYGSKIKIDYSVNKRIEIYKHLSLNLSDVNSNISEIISEYYQANHDKKPGNPLNLVPELKILLNKERKKPGVITLETKLRLVRQLYLKLSNEDKKA